MAHKILSTKSPPKFLLGGLYKFIKFDFRKPKFVYGQMPRKCMDSTTRLRAIR